MEATLSRTHASWIRGWPELDARVGWIWGLTVGLVLYLGIDGGGYDLVVRSDAGVVVWWLVLLGAVAGIIPAARLSRPGWAALGAFGAFVVWSGISTSWALSPERSLDELSRLVSYGGVLVLAVATFGDRERALRHVVAAVATAIAALALLALISRLVPDAFPAARTTGALLPNVRSRLSWPLNYWGALAALMALGLPLLLAVATSARSLLTQALAAGAIPILILTGYLTFSRGPAAAGIAALVAFLVLVPERPAKLLTAGVCAGGGAILIAGATHRHAVETAGLGSAASHQGTTLLVSVAFVCVGVALLQAGIGLAARHGTPPSILVVSPRRAAGLVVVAAVGALVLALALGAPHDLSHAWNSFKHDNSAALFQRNLNRFGTLSGNGRYTFWKTAIDALSGHWLNGFGLGSFQLVYLAHAPVWNYTTNAHSLFVETLTEVGLVGLVLLVVFLLIGLGTALRCLRGVSPESRIRAAGVFAACLAFSICATFDWIWQVPVIPIVLLLLLAAVLAPERSSPTAAGRLSRLSFRALAVLAAVASLALIGVPLASTKAVRTSQADASSGELSAALTSARSAVRAESTSSSAQLQVALVLELDGRYGAAVPYARQATLVDPHDWQPWLIRSRIEAEAGHAALSVAAYRTARSLNPRSPVFQQ
jgi:hypothetical protein